MTLPIQAQLARAGGVSKASQEVYLTKCASCHSIGGGRLVGPDLKGVAQRRDSAWLAKFIKAPSSMLDSDAEAKEMLAEYGGLRMPDLGLTDDQVADLVSMLDYCGGNDCDMKPSMRPLSEATEADIAHGRGIYLGSSPLENGGPACISCHEVSGAGSIMSGGTLAVDLTHVFARLGDTGLDAAVRNPAFPLMNKIFADHPVTEEEAFALRAFFDHTNRGTGGHGDDPFSVPVAAVVVAIIVIALLNAAWSRRLQGVRQPLINRNRREPVS